MLATIDAYEDPSGRRLLIDRVMAWHVLTVLGDALWRTEAGVALPGGIRTTRDALITFTPISSLDSPGHL